ncbi:sigma factor-like helix-turn-helix DNA-binding protein [Clostridium baratii]|uniref:sigma factor-like helix-turn-helix DNA-binding protein n=1 Tax=Clostridium baratii TaxID=1561 RepID=UPI0030CC5FC4
MNKIDDILVEYYKKRNEIGQLKSDIDVLEKNIEIIKTYKTNNMYLKDRINENINGLVCKKLVLDALIWEVSNINVILSTLDEEEKKIIELRYKRKKNYQDIMEELNISKSQFFRKLNLILLYIEKKLDEKREY